MAWNSGWSLWNTDPDFQGIMSGETSVDEGLKEAEDYANGLLDEYWANK